MKRLTLLVALGAIALVGCADDRPSTPTVATDDGRHELDANVEAMAWEVLDLAGWPVSEDEEFVRPEQEEGSRRPHLAFERTRLTGDVYHYYVEIPVGPGPYEFVGLHRVVKERRPYRPIRTSKTLFGLHGTPGCFEVMFLAGSVIPSAPDDQSLAVFLAQNDVDVWGIDQAYTLLPADIVDFSFMDGWGIGFDAANLRTAMGVARVVRLLTGNGFGKMNLMGYSTGFMTGFAALDKEAELPMWRRHIGGFIPVDYFYKTDDPAWIDAECGLVPSLQETLDAGVYQNDYGLLFQALGSLAESDPDGESPIIPGVTNLDAALLAAARTSLVFGFPGDIHFFAGVFDDLGNPVDLRYTALGHYLEWLQQFNNYGSNFMEYDIAVIHCDEEDSPYDDNLHLIDVPVFFLGANGGWGDLMAYTASLIGSSDITLLNVQLDPEKLLDIGHVDIFTAGNAEPEFWWPVLEWIQQH